MGRRANRIGHCEDCKGFVSNIEHDEDDQETVEINCIHPRSEFYTKQVMPEDTCRFFTYKGVFQ